MFNRNGESCYIIKYNFTKNCNFSDNIFCISTVDVTNVSLIPTDNPLILVENTYKEVKCLVNSNVNPAPTLVWYLDSTIITSVKNAVNSTINITRTKEDNMKMLRCSAANNNKPPLSTNTTLKIECKH